MLFVIAFSQMPAPHRYSCLRAQSHYKCPSSLEPLSPTKREAEPKPSDTGRTAKPESGESPGASANGRAGGGRLKRLVRLIALTGLQFASLRSHRRQIMSRISDPAPQASGMKRKAHRGLRGMRLFVNPTISGPTTHDARCVRLARRQCTLPKSTPMIRSKKLTASGGSSL
jgi:hypothetical protein